MKEDSFRKGVYMEEKPLNIAVLGLGSVGSKTVELLEQHQERIQQKIKRPVRVKWALVRSTTQTDKIKLAKRFDVLLTDSIDSILHDSEVELVIELLGRIEPAKTYIEACLAHKKSVITANKDLIATHGVTLQELACKQNVALLYEASVGGGIPIIHTLRQQFAFDPIIQLTGILNGTTNFILTKMLEEDLSYEHALSLAQELGYAESDPFNDVSGTDAAYKLLVLAQVAYGVSPKLSQIHLTGIESLTKESLQVAKQFGYKIKLLNRLTYRQQAFELIVAPMLLEEHQLLAQIDQETNALMIQSTQIGTTFLSGPGAGAAPTASSVLTDIFVYATSSTSSHYVSDQDVAVEAYPKQYGIFFKQPTRVKKFTNEQLDWIETIEHKEIHEQTYTMVTTKKILSEEKTQLVEQIESITPVLMCLDRIESTEKEGGQ